MCDPADDRGQSEPLGFLLIFGIVVLTIALVGLTGFAGLDNVQDFQRTTNVEQGFDVFATNVNDVVTDGAPGRTTEIQISGGSLSLRPTETTVDIDYANNTSTSTTIDSHAFVYESGTDTNVTYRSGALIRRDGESAVLLREPRFLLTDERVILPVVNLSSAGKVGGTTDVGVRTRSAGTRLLAAGAQVDGVTLTITSPNAAAWERYFGQFEAAGPVDSVTRSGDTVEVTIDTGQVYVTVHRIDVQFQ